MPYRAVKCKGYYNKINNAKISSAKIKSNINNLWKTTSEPNNLTVLAISLATTQRKA